MDNELTAPVRALLGVPNHCVVATLTRSGQPHQVVVWIDCDDDHILINSSPGRLWMKNLEREGRAHLLVVNHEQPTEYATVDATLASIEPDEGERHIDSLARRYLGADSNPYADATVQRVVVRLLPVSAQHFPG
jgi:PPOX class probable F420-dependent enzyme